MSNEAKADLVLDILVAQDGLDVSAIMQRKIKARIMRAIEATQKETRHKCLNIVKSSPNFNDLTDTDVKWIDQEDLILDLEKNP